MGKAEPGPRKWGKGKDKAGRALEEQVVLGRRSGVCKGCMPRGQAETRPEA